MNETVLRAINDALIWKWFPILLAGGRDESRADCPLCQLFPGYLIHPCYNHKLKEYCPVVKYTLWKKGQIDFYQVLKASGCKQTPYLNWHSYMRLRGVNPRRVIDKHSAELARAEIDFLKKVRTWYIDH